MFICDTLFIDKGVLIQNLIAFNLLTILRNILEVESCRLWRAWSTLKASSDQRKEGQWVAKEVIRVTKSSRNAISGTRTI